ncbi:DUF336-domain-containing protein, partial [Lophiostoma macrostomum CBS 122681]
MQPTRDGATESYPLDLDTSLSTPLHLNAAYSSSQTMLSSVTTAIVSHPSLTSSGARVALSAAELRAKEIGIPMNIAIADSHIHLLAFTPMDNAKITSIAIAIDKAFTASGHRVPTSAYKRTVWSGGVAFGIGHTNGGRFCTIGGGVPILDGEGNVLGAVGCSSGSPAQDEEVARAGYEAVLEVIGRETL